MKKKLTILIIIFFLQGIVTNVHHPVMPDYVESINLPDYMFGFFFAFMNLGIMLGGPFWGNLGDQGRKKQVVIFGLLLYGISQILFGMHFAFSQWPLSIIRIISGFGIAASFTVIWGEVILVSPKGSRARSIAIGAAALGIGGAIGQFLGGLINTNPFIINLLRTDQFFNMFLIQGVLVILLTVLVFIMFKPEVVVKDPEKEVKRTQFWEGFKEVRNVSKELLFFLLAISFISVAATNVDKYFDIYYRNFLGYGANDLGNFKMVIGLVSVFIGLILVPLFMKIKKKLLLISVFQIISAVIVLILFRTTGQTFIILLYTIYIFYIGIKAIYTPLEQEHISTFAREDNISTTMGIRQSFLSIGTIIGPIFGAFIYDYNPTLLFDTSVVFFLLAIILIYISSWFRKREQKLINLDSTITETYKNKAI